MAFKVGVGEGFESDPVSPGVHDAVVAEVVDLGRRHSRFRDGEVIHQGVFVLQVDENRTGGKFTGPKEIWQFFNAKAGIGDKTNLKRFLEGWRGKPFTADELAKIKREQMDLEEQCVGKALQVVVTHKVTGSGDTRAKIEASLPPNKDTSMRLKVRDYTPLSEREDFDLDATFGRPAMNGVEGVSMSGDDSNGGGSNGHDDDDIPF